MTNAVQIRNIVVTSLWLLAYHVTLCRSQGCGRLVISGIVSTDHYSLSGVYDLSIGQSCSARVVYKQVGGNGYLFYRSGNWIIGDRLCVDSGSLKTADGAVDPALITRHWEESDAGWKESPTVNITCYQRFAGCAEVVITGIRTASQYELSGVYRNASELTCTGHPVYTQLGGSFHLFFMFGHWVLAYEPCVSNVVYKALDAALYPENISVTWQLSKDGDWTAATDMRINCYNGFKGCSQLELRGVLSPDFQVLNAVYRVHTTHTCTGRYVYVTRTADSEYYIFYDNGHWIAGDRMCAGSGILKITDASLYVELATGTWEISIDSDWQTADTIHSVCYTGFAGCPDIQISGDRKTDLFSPVLSFGVYRRVDNITCTDRAIYSQLGGGYYLYHMGLYWMVGTQSCTDDSVLRVSDDVIYPEDVTVTWQERSGILWTPTDSVTTSCYDKFSGCHQVQLSGTIYNNDTIGVYNTTDNYCNGRRVYQSLGGARYMYYTASYWVVGSEMCTDKYRLKLSSVDQYPETGEVTWSEMHDGDWISNKNIDLQCYPGFKGCEQLSLYHTMTSSSPEGSYTVQLDTTCNGRLTYTHVSGLYYLYTAQGFWVIGTTRCSASDWLMRADAGDLYPDVISSRWYERKALGGVKVWVSSVAKLLCTGQHAVRITGTMYRHSAEGTYDVTVLTCNDRVVMKQRGGRIYMYYLGNGDVTHSGWYIGNITCSISGSLIFVTSHAEYPENITGYWRERERSKWVDNEAISLGIDTGFKGCPELNVIYRPGVNNIYSVTDVTYMCNGRYVYRHSSGRYMYAHGDGWVIGGAKCSPHGGLGARVTDGAIYPEDITATWRVESTNNQTIDVQCRKGCLELDLTTEQAGDVNGAYQILLGNSSCSGRTSYKHVTRDLYLYYVVNGDQLFRGWMIGSALCLDHGVARVWDPASYPEDIVHSWNYWNGTAWNASSSVTFTCLSQEDDMTTHSPDVTTAEESTTRPPDNGDKHNKRTVYIVTGIVIGGLVLLVMLIVILVICLRRNRNRSPKIPTQIHTNPMVNTNDENDNGRNTSSPTVRMSEIAMADVTSDTISNPHRTSSQYEKFTD